MIEFLKNNTETLVCMDGAAIARIPAAAGAADSFEAILISDDGTLYATSGLKGRISSEHEVVFLSR